MRDRLSRVAAIVRADYLIRFRRPSTVVVFLLLSATPYLWIPDPSTGRALLKIGGARAIYNSAAIGLATAMLCTIFVGLAGFYVISNAVRRDVASRCGFVIASTTVRSSEYVVGKFAGNLAFLATFAGGFMLTSAAMLLVRGEVPFDLLPFAWHYLVLVPPSLVFVAVVAIVFESIPWLSGRFGDVVYFFLWVTSLGVVAAIADESPGGVGFGAWFDYSGFAFMIEQMRDRLGGDGLSIGSSPFDPAQAPVVFEGLSLRGWAAARVGSLLTPLPLLAVATLCFHRFDPARVRQVSAGDGRGWLTRLNRLLKPATRLLSAGWGSAGTPGSLRSAVRNDAILTFASSPVSLLLLAAMVIASLVSSPHGLFEGVLPIVFAVAGVLVADVSCRERTSGTTSLVWSAPMLRERFVAWKLAVTLLVVAAFLIVPIMRALFASPGIALRLVIGGFFVAALATLLGVASSNPKTFIVVFLTFWYVVTQAARTSPSLDFAGFYGTATPGVTLAYLGLAVVACAVAEVLHRLRLKRDG